MSTAALIYPRLEGLQLLTIGSMVMCIAGIFACERLMRNLDEWLMFYDRAPRRGIGRY
jgi:hypothetical protein